MRGASDKELVYRDLLWRAGRGLLKQKARCTPVCSSQAQSTGSDACIPAAHKTIAILKYTVFSLPMSCKLLSDLYANGAWWRWYILHSESENYFTAKPEQVTAMESKGCSAVKKEGCTWPQQAANSCHLDCYDKIELGKNPLERNFQRVSDQSNTGCEA